MSVVDVEVHSEDAPFHVTYHTGDTDSLEPSSWRAILQILEGTATLKGSGTIFFKLKAEPLPAELQQRSEVRRM